MTRRRPTTADSLHVLVVEDDPDTRAMYSECLSHLGYRTATASSGEHAIDQVLRTRPDAVLMDVEMPGIGGLEATRRIKSDPRTRGCLVIVVTAYGAALFAKGRAAGCDAYFCKPFNPFA